MANRNGSDEYAFYVPFQDGTRKRIRYGPWALSLIEEGLGIGNILTFLGVSDAARGQQMMERLGFRALIVFVWAGLTGAGAEYTQREVADQLDPTRLSDYWDPIVKAVLMSLTGSTQPKPAAEEAQEDPTPAAPVGGPPAASTGGSS